MTKLGKENRLAFARFYGEGWGWVEGEYNTPLIKEFINGDWLVVYFDFGHFRLWLLKIYYTDSNQSNQGNRDRLWLIGLASLKFWSLHKF